MEALLYRWLLHQDYEAFIGKCWSILLTTVAITIPALMIYDWFLFTNHWDQPIQVFRPL
jgi:hypothetical protein